MGAARAGGILSVDRNDKDCHGSLARGSGVTAGFLVFSCRYQTRISHSSRRRVRRDGGRAPGRPVGFPASGERLE